ncbi:zinc finger MYND domain-containing protein 12 [Alligator sinensis]|uniref:Zinc finger MYND domain-containing protein 12 n=1 Tax=Alligator sinensis TaxID=38654 RepID=A0A1U7RH06_ALLSI|nr:zinc finger MYND domain-containing protein 12 [Alligator sinensis]
MTRALLARTEGREGAGGGAQQRQWVGGREGRAGRRRRGRIQRSCHPVVPDKGCPPAPYKPAPALRHPPRETALPRLQPRLSRRLPPPRPAQPSSGLRPASACGGREGSRHPVVRCDCGIAAGPHYRPLLRVHAPFREKSKRSERRDNGLASRNPVEGYIVKPCFPRCAASDADHQKADWDSIHEKICPLLTPVRTSVPFFSSEKERKHGAEQLLRRQKYIADLTYEVAQKFLYEGKHEEAIPAALHSLRFSISIYGSNSVKLVPAYLILAEASTGLGHLTQADEYLSQAQWIVLKTPDCTNAIQSKLHRNLGLVNAAKGDFEQSLYNVANDIYFASCAFGTHDTSTSGGYFHMANVFFRQNKMDIADSLYSEATDIWHAHFSRLIQIQSQTLKSATEIDILAGNVEASGEPLSEAQQAEASQILNAILDIREQAPKQKPDKMAIVLHALAMLHYFTMDLPKAHELGVKASLITQQLQNQDLLEDIRCLLKLIKSKNVSM